MLTHRVQIIYRKYRKPLRVTKQVLVFFYTKFYQIPTELIVISSEVRGDNTSFMMIHLDQLSKPIKKQNNDKTISNIAIICIFSIRS
jgi:hypothetical protein